MAKAKARLEPAHLKDLTPDPRNARKHSPRNVGMIVDALQEVGAARSIVIDEAGTILAGNATAEAAAEAGLTRIQVVDVDGQTLVAVRRTGLSKAQKARLALFDNRSAELADGWDIGALKALQADGVDLSNLWRDDELSELLGTEPKQGRTDPDAVPELRATSIKLGDLFQLGQHRLLCGDATSPEGAERVIAADKPTLCLTDPPYNVGRDYTDKTDDKRADYRDWSASWFALARAHCGNVAFSCGHPNVPMWAQIEPWKWIICWYKPAAMLGSPFGVSNWEPVLFYGTTRSRGRDVVEAPIVVDRDLDGHPVPKPIKFGEGLLTLLSDRSDIVYDPFSGSGTTLLAAERTKRVCCGMELEPSYCQVIIDRWEAFTGQKAEKLGEVVRAS